MRLAGWRTRKMVDRYGADMADLRAMDAKRRMGDMYWGRVSRPVGRVLIRRAPDLCPTPPHVA